jgi:hypothetical protein
VDCKNPRKIDRSKAPGMDSDSAWQKILAAAKERDLDEVKEGIEHYAAAMGGDVTYSAIEKTLRQQSAGVYLIATEKKLLSTYTNMDLQGNLEKKYTVQCRFSDKPARPREATGWPKSPEENLDRLQDAGIVVERRMTKCSNCGELGHTKKACKQEDLRAAERVVIKCFNCGEEGHRIRDCRLNE